MRIIPNTDANRPGACPNHPAFDADYCPACGTTVPISERHTLTEAEVSEVKEKAEAARLSTGAPVISAPALTVDFCDTCEKVHPAEYSHEGRFGQGAIYAVVCDDGLTDYYTAERIRGL